MSPPITFERADEIKRCYDSALTLTGSRIHKKFLNFIYSIKSYCWGGHSTSALYSAKLCMGCSCV